MPELEIVEGPGAPRKIHLPLTEDDWVVGTDASCQVVLEDEDVQSRHARIRRKGLGYTIEPMAERCVVELNGEDAEASIPLEDADEILLGRTRLVWSPGDAIEAVSMGISLEDSIVSGGGAVIAADGLVAPRPYVGREITTDTGATFHEGAENVVTGDHLMDAVTHAVTSLRDQGPGFEPMLASLVIAFAADRALLYLPFGGDRPRLVASFLGPAELDAEEGLTHDLLQTVKDAGIPVLVNASTATVQLPDTPAVGASGGLRSLLAAPVHGASGEGTLVVDGPAERRSYDEQDQALLSRFAGALSHLLATSSRIRRMEEVIENWSRNQKISLETRRRQTGGEDRPELLAALRQAAESDGPVLLVGEPGVGKRTAAMRLHLESSRAAEPALVVDCAGSGDLLGSLFGRVDPEAEDKRGPGALELTERGTLVIHHATALPIGAQSRLEAYLDSGHFETEGRRSRRSSSARLVLTSDRDPREAGGGGWFLTTFLERFGKSRVVEVPPLRDTPEFLEAMARTILCEYAARLKKPVRDFAEDARDLLLFHPWPGNEVELRFVIEAAVSREDGELLRLETLEQLLRGVAAR